MSAIFFLRGTGLEQNIITTENWEEYPMMQFSQDSGYMQNPILSTSIQPGPMAR